MKPPTYNEEKLQGQKQIIQCKTLQQWIQLYPVLENIIKRVPVLWFNPNYENSTPIQSSPIQYKEIYEAEALLQRFAPLIAKLFSETVKSNGIIESPIKCISNLKMALNTPVNTNISGSIWAKLDNQLPISGSIKARGGIYEVLKIAEDILFRELNWVLTNDYTILSKPQYRSLFQKYIISVGSTGNLGMSIGIMGRKLGFRVCVYMSGDAKEWKKNLLKEQGVEVISVPGDYTQAVKKARNNASINIDNIFVDDEHSKNLFLGYSVAALRLKKQMEQENVIIDENHPLFVYLPCGVGGSPGGINFGLKHVFGKAVHCFYGEPSNCPSMLLGLITQLHDKISLEDFGQTTKTEADGLACPRPSKLVGKVINNMVCGIYTLNDNKLFEYLTLLKDMENISIEPSAAISLPGPSLLANSLEITTFMNHSGINYDPYETTHLVWLTGGNLVPPEEFTRYYERGRATKLP